MTQSSQPRRKPAGKSGLTSGRQQLKQRVHTAGKRSPASTRWLDRQLNDPYVAAAQRDGYRSRAAYKLIQIDEKVPLLKPGLRVVDLGAAPGGWTQVAAARIGAEQGRGRLIALDRLPIDPIPGATILHMDFMAPDAPDRLKEALGGPADLVLSDLSPNTTGHTATDHLRIIGLVETALQFAVEVLAPGGSFVAKLFQGGAGADLMTTLKQDFVKVRHVKPDASRQESAEIYLIAEGFRTK